jgi:hypothetical protein
MFIALFCYGTATAAGLLAISMLVAATFRVQPLTSGNVTIAVVLVCVAWLLDTRGREFEVQALSTPYAIATAELAERGHQHMNERHEMK